MNGSLRCAACGREYPSYFGIPDLRGETLGVSGGTLDREADIEKAAQLRSSFASRTYLEWLNAVEPSRFTRAANARQEMLHRRYRQHQIETFGVHGDVMMARVDGFLAAEAPHAYARWRDRQFVALEAGCGEGHYIAAFARRFTTVLVADISYVSLIQAQKIKEDLRLENVVLFAGDAEALPLPTDSVDFFHCNDVLEHVRRPDRVVGECARVLSATGVAFFLSPNKYSLLVEPHHRVIAYGFWPEPLRRALTRRFTGGASSTASPLSLWTLRRLFNRHFSVFYLFMLPRRLTMIGRTTLLRRTLQSLLQMPAVGWIVHALINKALLAVVPYHSVVALKRSSTPH